MPGRRTGGSYKSVWLSQLEGMHRGIAIRGQIRGQGDQGISNFSERIHLHFLGILLKKA